MSAFFEITAEDLILVAQKLGKTLSFNDALDLMDELDLDFEKDLQNITDFEEQTQIVHRALLQQMSEIWSA